jgi:hypothetical protein
MSVVPVLLALVFGLHLSTPADTREPTADVKIEITWKPDAFEKPTEAEIDLLSSVLDELQRTIGNRERSHGSP